MSAATRNWADDGSESEGEDLVPQKKAPEPVKPAAAPAPAAAAATAAPAHAHAHQDQRREHHAPREGGAGRGGERGGDRGFVRRDRERSPPRAPAEINPNGPFIIFISNLPNDITEAELRTYFHHADCECRSISLPMDKTSNRPKGYAHIEFKDKPTLLRALTANGKNLKGRVVTVEVGRSQGSRGDRDRDRKFGGDRKFDRKPEGAPADGAAASSETPVVRKKLELAPRTKPVEAVGAPVGNTSSYSSIFGGGKPREETAAPAPPAATTAEPAVAAVTEKIGELAVEAPAAPAAANGEKKAPAGERRDRPKRAEGAAPRDGAPRPKSDKPSDSSKDGRKSSGARPGSRPAAAPAAAPKKSTPRTTTTEEGWTSAVSTSAPVKEQNAAPAVVEKKAAKTSNVFALLNDESEEEN